MDNMLDTIRRIAHKAAEDYLVKNANMDTTILSEIDDEVNSEIIKRISELANQNVYLSKYNDPSVNRGTISFDMANADNIISELQKSESAMNDYLVDPEDFRGNLDVAVMPGSEEFEPDFPEFDESEKTSALHEVTNAKASFEKFLAQVETMKYAEYKAMESAFNKMERDAKAMVFNGDSIGDIAKIAMLSVDADKYVKMKIAALYNEIAGEMKRSGFKVNEELTKVSSLSINRDAPIVKPPQEFALSLQKYAAFNEMSENLKAMVKVFDSCEKGLLRVS